MFDALLHNELQADHCNSYYLLGLDSVKIWIRKTILKLIYSILYIKYYDYM